MLVLHIGLPKTGTTFLQYRVFRHAPGVSLVHRRQGRPTLALMYALRHHGQASAAVASLERPFIAGRLGRLATDDRPVVLSDESISLVQYRFWSGRAAGPERVAERLSALASRLQPGACRVILGIRRQDQWLASSYAHCAERGRGFCQADFDQRLAEIGDGIDGGAMDWIDYSRVRDAFCNRFGTTNVLLVALERLSAAPRETLAAIGRFVGSDLGMPKARKAGASNQRAIGDATWKARQGDGLLRLEPGLAAAVRARFEASNRALTAEVALAFEP